jgi:hypothetical protein
MDIKNIGMPSTPLVTGTPLEKEETPPMPKESFSRSATESLGLISNASFVMEAKGLEKQSTDYKMQSYTISPEGTTYISYSSSKIDEDTKQKKGYISAVSPEGKILWEAPLNEDKLGDLDVGPDGTIYAITKEHMRALNPDGTSKFEHKFEEPVKNHWMDSEGNHYFVSAQNELYKSDRSGTRVALPEGLKGVKGCEFKQASADEMYVRQGNTISVLDLKEGKKKGEFVYKDPAEKRDNFSRSIDHFDIGSDGMVKLWIINSTYTPGPPVDYGDLHMGLGFGRWGMGMGRHLPPFDDGFSQSSVYNETSIENIDNNGSIKWKVENLGSSPIAAQLPDGRIVYTNNREIYVPNPNYVENPPPGQYVAKTISSGKISLGIVGPEGQKSEEALTVDGRISKIMANPESGNFFICHGEKKVSQFDSKGDPVATREYPERKGDDQLYPFGLAGKETIILRDLKSERAYALDMKSGVIVDLTDKSSDLSYKVSVREREEEQEVNKDGQIVEDFGEWINVAGIHIEKKKEASSDR